MHPTIDEQLRGVRRLLQRVAGDESLSPASSEALDDASRMLRRVEASWPRMLPFLERDNQETAALLRQISPLLPAQSPVAAALAADAAGGAEGTDDALDLMAAHERNTALRGLLARAVAALPDGDAGQRARAAVATHLRRRLDTDPSFARLPRE